MLYSSYQQSEGGGGGWGGGGALRPTPQSYEAQKIPVHLGLIQPLNQSNQDNHSFIHPSIQIENKALTGLMLNNLII